MVRIENECLWKTLLNECLVNYSNKTFTIKYKPQKLSPSLTVLLYTIVNGSKKSSLTGHTTSHSHGVYKQYTAYKHHENVTLIVLLYNGKFDGRKS